MYAYFFPVNHCIFCLLFTWWCNNDSLFFQERVGCVHCCKFPRWQQLNHRMIRLMEGNAKCCHLKKLTCKGTLQLVFIGVYRLEIAIFLSSLSFGIFTLLWCPSHRFSGSTPPLPPFPVWISILHVYTYTVCKGEGVGFLSLQTDKHLPQSPFKGNFFRWRHFAFVSI